MAGDPGDDSYGSYLPNWKDTASGLVGAFFCTYAGLPFDTCKVRLQNQAAAPASPPPQLPAAGPSPPQKPPLQQRYRGLGDCMWRTAAGEGPAALFRGALPALGSAAAENMVGFTTQRLLSRLVASRQPDPTARLPPLLEVIVGAGTGCGYLRDRGFPLATGSKLHA